MYELDALKTYAAVMIGGKEDNSFRNIDKYRRRDLEIHYMPRAGVVRIVQRRRADGALYDQNPVTIVPLANVAYMIFKDDQEALDFNDFEPEAVESTKPEPKKRPGRPRVKK